MPIPPSGHRSLSWVRAECEPEKCGIVQQTHTKRCTLHADEAAHWDAPHAKYQTHQIDHSEAFSLDGACTNQTESSLARLGRAVDGQHHHVSPQYLHQHANHATWLGD